MGRLSWIGSNVIIRVFEVIEGGRRVREEDVITKAEVRTMTAGCEKWKGATSQGTWAAFSS